MMGNDDLLCPGALKTIGNLLTAHPDVAVAIRSYGWFYENPSDIAQVVHYFPNTCIFPPGEDTVVTFFRRVGVLAGLVFRREDALAVSTDQFDGTLYYQVYLAAELLLRAHGLYIDKTIAICREGKPDFGHSTAEQGKFQPGVYTSDARIEMIRSLLRIAEYMDAAHQCKMYTRILKDLGNYSYVYLSFQANLPFPEFWRYYRILGEIGFDHNLLFHFYFYGLVIFGKARCESMVKFLRSKLRATPRLGGISAGTPL